MSFSIWREGGIHIFVYNPLGYAFLEYKVLIVTTKVTTLCNSVPLMVFLK